MASRPRCPGHPTDPDVKARSSALFVSCVVCALASVAARAHAADGGPAMSLHGDLMTPAEAETTTVEGALGSGSGNVLAPKVFYLRYADGSETHTSNYDACNTGKVPKFECTFAPTLVECQRQIQAYLDAWYADFNVIFTLTRPTSGKYYTEVVSSGGGAWCKVDDKVAGVAPFLCNDLSGGVAYTFQGGRNARETAVIIAQEQAHLAGWPEAVGVRVHGGHTDPQRSVPVAQQRREDGARVRGERRCARRLRRQEGRDFGDAARADRRRDGRAL